MEFRSLNGFIDSNAFNVIDNVPYYNRTGNTYMEVFRSGLSLEDITEFNILLDDEYIYQRNMNDKMDKNNEYENKTENTNTSPTFTKHLYEADKIVYDDTTCHSTSTYRGKYIVTVNPNKLKKINKKHKLSREIRRVGNDWKNFRIDQEQGEEVDIEPLPTKIIKKPELQAIDMVPHYDWEDFYQHRYRSIDEYDEYGYDEYEYYDFDMDEPNGSDFENEDERELSYGIWRITQKYISAHRM